jgi:hypothetical protein
MPQFGHKDGFDMVALITGPTHVLLGIRFTDAPSTSIELVKRPRVGTCDHGPLDEERITEAIRAGVAAANAETGALLGVAQAFYIQNDSPDYQLFQRGAYLLASRRSRPAE